MFTKLHLKNFKNFRSADIDLGPFTILIGANASGKSNIRDAFRLFSGLCREFGASEIFGEVWGESGELLWGGLRGGTRGAAFAGEDAFKVILEWNFLGDHAFEVAASIPPSIQSPVVIEPRLTPPGHVPGFMDGSLGVNEEDRTKIGDENDGMSNGSGDYSDPIKVDEVLKEKLATFMFRRSERLIAQHRIEDYLLKSRLKSIRFLEMLPHSMRRPCYPSQIFLGEHGDNLSGVLKAICDDAPRKEALLDWIKELTPMDARDIHFVEDINGRIQLILVEEGGHRISAESISDGTLRFLGLLAALMGPKAAQFYFIEELETGIHPSRLHLLMDLFEQYAYRKENPIQIVATTHNPFVLQLAQQRPRTLEHAQLVYRLPGEAEGRVRRILDIPHIREVLEKQDLARLHAAGWMEDAVALAEEAPAVP